MLNLLCAFDHPNEPRPEATVLEVEVATGEITAACAHHGVLNFGSPLPGFVTVGAAGPLHSTSLILD